MRELGVQRLKSKVSRLISGAIARKNLENLPSPSVKAPTAELDRILDSIRPLEYLHESNLKIFISAFERCSAKEEFLIKLMHFFIMRPRFGVILNTKYYSRIYKGNIVFDLMTMTIAFVEQKYDLAIATIKPHLERSDRFIYIVLGGLYRVKGEIASEQAILSDALARFPNDPIVQLTNVEFYARIGKTAHANELLENVKSFVTNQLSSEIEGVKGSGRDLKDAIAKRKLSRSESFDVYDDNLTRLTWFGYYEKFVAHQNCQSGDKTLQNFVNAKLTKFVKETGIAAMVDFGSLCAGFISPSAEQCPETEFIGIDRQEFVAQLNYEAYDLKNMKFESGDIFEYLPKFSLIPGKKVFFHVRTTCLLYPELVLKIYQEVANSGVEFIMMAEGDGLSRETLEFYDFDSMPAISIARKGVLFNHNYRELMLQAGYEIIHYEKLPSMNLWREVSELVGAGRFIIAQLKRH